MMPFSYIETTFFNVQEAITLRLCCIGRNTHVGDCVPVVITEVASLIACLPQQYNLRLGSMHFVCCSATVILLDSRAYCIDTH